MLRQLLLLSAFCLLQHLAALPLAAQAYLPSDSLATKSTKALMAGLGRAMQQGVMFGHQDDMAYGVGWKYEPGRSDIRDITGDYPAVFGWELGHLERGDDKNLDGVPFNLMREFIRQGHRLGGVITISWHLRNPLTGQSAWDPADGTLRAILPGGEKHALYNKWLDTLAGFLGSLRDDAGQAIPVVFRPYHEWSGDWFWWGKSHCTPAEFIALFRYTIGYLREQKHLHHLLIAFNPDRFESTAAYMERYPGDDVVDVLGFDIYQRNSHHEVFVQDVQRMLGMLNDIAGPRGKIPAITELGYNTIPEPNWWTQTLLPAISGNGKAAWVLTWRNAGTKHNGSLEFFAPYKGHSSAPDFLRFYEAPNTLFCRDAASLQLYHLTPRP